MIYVFTEEDAKKESVPDFVKERFYNLLSILACDNLIDAGSVIIPQSAEDIGSISFASMESTERFINNNEAWWHVIVPRNNSYCEEIFIKEELMSKPLIEECTEYETKGGTQYV